MDALSDEIEQDVKRRYEAGTPYSSKDFEGMTDKEHRLVLAHSAELQRDRPEKAMLAIQKKLGGGVYSNIVMQVGDIYHRAHERVHNPWHGWNLIKPKLMESIHDLTRPYGFEREMRENLVDNSNFDKDKSINWDTAVVLGKEYAKEHARLPIYNEPAYWYNKAAIHLGNMRFGAAAGALSQIAHHFQGEEDDVKNWVNAHSRQASIDFLRSQGH